MSRIQEELKRSFELASLRHEVQKGLSGDDWQRYSEIRERHDRTRQAISRSYEVDYPDLIAREKRRLINEAGEKTVDFKHRLFGTDKFDKDQLHRRAHNRVVEARRRDLGDVDRKEAAALRQLQHRSEAHTRLREKPKEEFTRATERRSGEDRRRGPSRS